MIGTLYRENILPYLLDNISEDPTRIFKNYHLESVSVGEMVHRISALARETNLKPSRFFLLRIVRSSCFSGMLPSCYGMHCCAMHVRNPSLGVAPYSENCPPAAKAPYEILLVIIQKKEKKKTSLKIGRLSIPEHAASFTLFRCCAAFSFCSFVQRPFVTVLFYRVLFGRVLSCRYTARSRPPI